MQRPAAAAARKAAPAAAAARKAAPAAAAAYLEHIAVVRACTRCTTVVGPPIVGPAPGARILWIGQAPGPREGDAGRPFAWTAGRTMFGWFEPYGVGEALFRARIHLAAVVRCFPGRSPHGGDRVPSRAEIANCFPYVVSEVELLRPELVVPVGRLAIERFLDRRPLRELIGRRFDGRVGEQPLSVVPLPHPSGRSTWCNRPAHRALLARAIHLIVEHPAWQCTFGERQRAGAGAVRSPAQPPSSPSQPPSPPPPSSPPPP